MRVGRQMRQSQPLLEHPHRLLRATEHRGVRRVNLVRRHLLREHAHFRFGMIGKADIMPACPDAFRIPLRSGVAHQDEIRHA